MGRSALNSAAVLAQIEKEQDEVYQKMAYEQEKDRKERSAGTPLVYLLRCRIAGHVPPIEIRKGTKKEAAK